MIRLPRAFLTTVAAAALTVAAAGCAVDPENTRIDTPVDLSVKSHGGRPESGIYAGGGTFRLTDITIRNGECRVDLEGGFEALMELVDPFDTQNLDKDTSQAPLDPSHLGIVSAFLDSVELRTDDTGSALVIGTAADSSQSLPWTGKVKGGAADILVATALVQGVDERAVDLRVESPEAAPGVDQQSVAANVTLVWTELPLVPAWIYQVDAGAGRCKADGSATLVRTGGPLPPAPTAPAGAATVLSVTPPAGPGSPLGAATSLVSSLTWRPPPSPDDRNITMALPDGSLAGQGVLSQAGGGWAVFVKGESGGIDFRIRGWKIEDGRVSGSLLAGDDAAVSLASVDLAG